ncbi:MAG: cysteine desulfurase family protein [Opitutales bacterium]
MDYRFFDYNATTPLWPAAKAAWNEASDELWLNPSSPYRAAARVAVRLDAFRERLADYLGVEPARVVFNSGATEGNNAVFAHWSATLPKDARVGVNPTEHPSVIEAARAYFGGERIVWLDVDANGVVDAGALKESLQNGMPAALSVMAANNETGVLQPWPAIARACREAGVPFHCDASQWLGKRSPEGLDACDFITGCGHKFGGPRGVGFLVLPSGDAEWKSLRGGSQERGRRAGSQDVAGVAALIAALDEVEPRIRKADARLRDTFVAELQAVAPGVRAVGAGAERLWNTASLLMPGFDSMRWIGALEKRGFLVSAGSACSTGKQGPSHVLAAMGMETGELRRVLRVSSGWETSREDWTALGEAVASSYEALKSEASTSTSHVISID